MGRETLFSIDELKTAAMKAAATTIDNESKKKYRDGKIDEKEAERLQKLLNNNAILKEEAMKEDAKIANLLGLQVSAAAAGTDAAEVKADATTNVTTSTLANPEAARYSEVSKEYLELRKTGKGPYEAYKAVKEAHKGDDSYKTAIKRLKQQAKNVDAQIDAINAIHKSDAESKRVVKKDAKATLADADGGKIDKWHKRAINGNPNVVTWLSGEDSTMKEVRRSQAYNNRAERIKKEGVTMDDIVKRLGEDCPYLQTTTVKDAEGKDKQVTLLEAAGLMKQRPDGKYDISELSDFVYNFGTGGDNSQSRQQNKAVAERGLLLAEMNTRIKTATGVDLSQTRIKDKYSKRLVKLTGRHIEKKNVLANVYANTVGGALAATAGTLGALATTAKDVVKGTFSASNYVEFNLNLEGNFNLGSSIEALKNDPAVKEMIEQGVAQINTTSDKVQIIIDQSYKQPFFHVASKHYLENALKAGAIGAAIGLLGSLVSYGKSEQEEIPHKTDCKTFDEYVTYIDSMVTNKKVKPLYGELAKEVAFAFTDKDGNMDCNGMNKFLGYEASNGSRLNRAELMSALRNLKTKLVEEEHHEEVKKPTYTGYERTIEGEVKKVKAPTTEKFEDWGVFASRYDCLKDVDGSKFKYVYDSRLKRQVPDQYSRTMMKVMQAIKDDNYDWNRLQELTDAAMSSDWKNKLQNVEGFDFKVYEALRGNKRTNTFGMTKQNMPTITIVNGDNVQIDLCAPDKPKYQIGRQNGGNGKRVGLGEAHNTHKGDDRFESHLETSDKKVNINPTNHEQYTTRKAELSKDYEWVEPEKK